MRKYEAMLIFRGDLEQTKIETTLKDLIKVINAKDIKVKSLGLLDLAYEIAKLKKGWYYQLNFECEDQESLREFRRLSRNNKNLIRQLIINLEKDYGYRASQNQKKIAKNKKAAEINKKKQEELKNNI